MNQIHGNSVGRRMAWGAFAAGLLLLMVAGGVELWAERQPVAALDDLSRLLFAVFVGYWSYVLGMSVLAFLAIVLVGRWVANGIGHRLAGNVAGREHMPHPALRPHLMTLSGESRLPWSRQCPQ